MVAVMCADPDLRVGGGGHLIELSGKFLTNFRVMIPGPKSTVETMKRAFRTFGWPTRRR